jgi:putative membrane protein
MRHLTHAATLALMVAFAPAAQAQTSTAPAAAPGTVAPTPGANSFTEAQAKARIEANGFSGVSSLLKDGNGVWRGAATKDGKSVQVSLDYKGDIVVVR